MPATNQGIQLLKCKKQLNNLDHQFRNLVYQIHRIPGFATVGFGHSGYIQFLRCGEKVHFDKCTMQLQGQLDFICDLKGVFASGLIFALEDTIADLEIPDANFEPHDFPDGPPELSSLQAWRISFGDDGILPLFGSDSGIFNPGDYPLAFEQARLHYREMRRSWQKLSRAVRDFADLNGLSQGPNIPMRIQEINNLWAT